jgi:hypothetical protein
MHASAGGTARSSDAAQPAFSAVRACRLQLRAWGLQLRAWVGLGRPGERTPGWLGPPGARANMPHYFCKSARPPSALLLDGSSRRPRAWTQHSCCKPPSLHGASLIQAIALRPQDSQKARPRYIADPNLTGRADQRAPPRRNGSSGPRPRPRPRLLPRWSRFGPPTRMAHLSRWVRAGQSPPSSSWLENPSPEVIIATDSDSRISSWRRFTGLKPRCPDPPCTHPQNTNRKVPPVLCSDPRNVQSPSLRTRSARLPGSESEMPPGSRLPWIRLTRLRVPVV